MASTEALETQGVVLKRGDGGSPETFTAIGKVVSFQGPGGTANVIDVTSLESTAREKLMGIADEGQFTFDVNLRTDDTQQMGLKDDRVNRTLRNFELHLTDTGTTVLSWAGYVLGFSISGAVDDKIGASITVEISGAVTWT
jgi:hypothetical protein